MRSLFIFAVLLATGAARAANIAAEASAGNDIAISVSLDPAEQSGSASATVRIHAQPRSRVVADHELSRNRCGWCPGSIVCDVLETAPDQSWQRIRHVMNYSWYVPKLTYVIRATYDRPSKRIDRTDLRGSSHVLRGSWELQSDGDYTIAHYTVDLAPGFWVPQLDRADGAAERPAEDAACAALPC